MIGKTRTTKISLGYVFLTQYALRYRSSNIAYRLALWYPFLVSHVITICVPYFPSRGNFVPLESLTKLLYRVLRIRYSFKAGS